MALSQDESPLPAANAGCRCPSLPLATLLVTAVAGQLSIALPAILAFNADLTLASWIASRLRADYGLALFTLREIVGSCRNRKSIQCRVCSLCGQCSGCGMVSECRTIDLVSCAPGRRQRTHHGQQFRAGDGFVSAGRAGASHGHIRRNGLGAWLYIGPGARRITYLRFWVAFEFVSIGGACVRWFRCCPLFAAAGKFQRLVGEKRAFRIFPARSLSHSVSLCFCSRWPRHKRDLAQPPCRH